MARKRAMPDYAKLTDGKRAESTAESFPAVFNRDLVPGEYGRPFFRPGHTMNQRYPNAAPVKKQRLRDQLAVAWASAGDADRALQLAAFAVGGDVTDIPEHAKESLATLTAWVFAMRAVGGSVEHFREIGDRIDPKPKRIEIEGVTGARRGGGGSDPAAAEAASDYYAALSGAVVDVTFTKEDEDDLSFLD